MEKLLTNIRQWVEVNPGIRHGEIDVNYRGLYLRLYCGKVKQEWKFGWHEIDESRIDEVAYRFPQIVKSMDEVWVASIRSAEVAAG